MLIESPFTPPHFSLANGLGTEAEAFKSWYATLSPLFPCHGNKGGHEFPMVQIQDGGPCIDMILGMSVWRPAPKHQH